jgi:hypothetical protein
VRAGRASARVVRGAKQRGVGDGDAHDLDIGLLDDGAAILAGVLVAGDQLAAAPVRPVERVLKVTTSQYTTFREIWQFIPG